MKLNKGLSLYLVGMLFPFIFVLLFLIPPSGFAQDVRREKIAALEKVDVPVWEIGDTWIYQRADQKTWELRVVRIEGDLYIAENSFINNSIAFDKNTLEPKFIIDQKGDRSATRIPFIDFPLYVGKKWNQVVVVSSSTGTNIFREFTCLSHENVKVLSGSFNALSIKLKATGTKESRSIDTEACIWYSPEVKNIIKLEFKKTGNRPALRDYELISFRLKHKPLVSETLEKRETSETVDKFSYLVENGSKMIRENDFEKVFGLIRELPPEKKGDFRIKVIENSANLKAYLITKKREYGKAWQVYYKTMCYSGDKTATPILVDLLKDSDPYMRGFTARALGYLGDQTALEALRRVATSDPNSKVRSRAKDAYKQLSGGNPLKGPFKED
jgi:hypothetical protein